MYESIISLFEQYPTLKTFMTLTMAMTVLITSTIVAHKVMVYGEETKKNEKG